MEQEHIENEFQSLEINDQIKVHFLEATKWSKFLSLVGIIGISLSFITILVFFFISFSNIIVGVLSSVFFIVLFYIVLIALYSVPLYFLYKFSKLTKIGIQHQNGLIFADGIKYLKFFFKYLGILVIILLVLYLAYLFSVVFLLF